MTSAVAYRHAHNDWLATVAGQRRAFEHKEDAMVWVARQGICPECASAVDIDPRCEIVKSKTDEHYFAPAALCSRCEFCIELTEEDA